jgi:hypothetical protein
MTAFDLRHSTVAAGLSFRRNCGGLDISDTVDGTTVGRRGRRAVEFKQDASGSCNEHQNLSLVQPLQAPRLAEVFV